MLEVENLKHHCRLCLSNEQNVSLFSEYQFSIQYYKLALALANIQISENDNLPHSICHECSSKLIIFYKFKQKCESSYCTLTSLLNSLDQEINETNFKKENEFETLHVHELINHSTNDIDIGLGLVQSNEENDKMVLSFFQTEDMTGYDDPLTQYIQEDINSLPVTVECFESEPRPLIMPKLVEFNSPITISNYNENKPIVLCDKEIVKPQINHQCELCGQTFSHKSSLTQHYVSHTGIKNFSCDLCHKRFTRKAHLSIHMRIHDNIKPYICEVCSKTFTKSGDLARHQRIHIDEKKYQCSVCKKRFKRSGDVISHMRSHTGDRPFKCKYANCDKAYTSHSSLKKHWKKHL